MPTTAPVARRHLSKKDNHSKLQIEKDSSRAAAAFVGMTEIELKVFIRHSLE